METTLIRVLSKWSFEVVTADGNTNFQTAKQSIVVGVFRPDIFNTNERGFFDAFGVLDKFYPTYLDEPSGISDRLLTSYDMITDNQCRLIPDTYYDIMYAFGKSTKHRNTLGAQMVFVCASLTSDYQ